MPSARCPRNGITTASRELLGVKRAAYALPSGEAITRAALEWGRSTRVVRGLRDRAGVRDRGPPIPQPRTVRPADYEDRQAAVEATDRERPGRRLRITEVATWRKKKAVPGEGHIATPSNYVRAGVRQLRLAERGLGMTWDTSGPSSVPEVSHVLLMHAGSGPSRAVTITRGPVAITYSR